MNKRLERQVQKNFGDPGQLPEDIIKLLNVISQSYDEYEDSQQPVTVAAKAGSEIETGPAAEDKRTTKELEKTFSIIEATIEAITDGILVIDCDGKFTWSNNKFIDLWNIPAEVLNARDDEKLISFLADQVLYPEEFFATISALPIAQQDKNFDLIKCRDGRSFEIYSQPQIIKGDCAGRVWSFRNVTERTKAEEKLLHNERYNRSLFDQSPVGLALSLMDGTLEDINEAYAKITGRTIGECKKMSYYEITPKKYGIQELEKLMDLKLTGRYGPYEKEYIHKDGHLVPVRLSGTLIESGGIKYIWSSVEDITSRKKAEADLRNSEERYRQMVETAQEGIWMIDENNNTTFINKKMCEIIEYSSLEVIGKKIHSFMDENANRHAADQIKRRKLGLSETHDSVFITKSGKHISTNVSTNPIFDDNGIYKGALAMVTDVTKRKLGEELIKKSELSLDLKNKELKRKNMELEQFAYVASHDLQEPLRTISSFVQLLKQQYYNSLDENANRYLTFIVDSSDRMRILINDLLDYSRIGGKHELVRVDCNKIMQDVIADLHKVISESGAEVKVSPLPTINGYPTEIKQLFQNLVINAIKFGKKNVVPQISITAVKSARFWDFAIADNGIGIEKTYGERIFIIFQRLHNRSEYPGSGIGLSHCKKIVELHHGRIWVDSEPGTGSVFHFTIPENDE